MFQIKIKEMKEVDKKEKRKIRRPHWSPVAFSLAAVWSWQEGF